VPKIAIVEDDPLYAEQISDLLKQYEQEHAVAFSVVEFGDGDLLLDRYKSDYDIILMDIELPFLDGMTTAERIRQVDDDVTIIFVTNMPQYAIRGYRVGALDYILKPLNYFSFAQAITRALKRRGGRGEKYVVLGTRNQKNRTAVSQIRYVEVLDHELTVHTTDGDFAASGTLRALIEELEGCHFVQCAKSYLVNLAFVDGIEGKELVVGADRLPVSRSRYKEVIAALNAYVEET